MSWQTASNQQVRWQQQRCAQLTIQPARDPQQLPREYSTAQRQAVLKRHGLAHEGTPDPHFFIHCAKHFDAIKDDLSRDDSRRLSRLLVDMLQGNADSCQNNCHAATRLSLLACPVFKSADLHFPYSNSEHPTFTSLCHSTDHDRNRLVSLAVPVTDNAHGDTKELRARLGLPAEPLLEHVVSHMLKMAAAGHMGTLSKQSSRPLIAKQDESWPDQQCDS